MYERINISGDQTGCWLDNHRGHYITRDMIDLAVDNFGYIIGPFEKYALAHYEDWYSDHKDISADGLYEALIELSDDVLNWLNGGDNEGKDRAIQGQNSPPVIPDGYQWAWEEGDFGLWKYDDEGEFVLDQ